MSGGKRPVVSPPDGTAGAPNAWQDWVTLWQSELTAMASDRELQESWQALIALWAGAAQAMLRPPPGPSRQASHAAHGQPGAAAAAGATAAAPASDARDVEIDRLRERVAGLERRLAELERGASRTDEPPERRRHNGA